MKYISILSTFLLNIILSRCTVDGNDVIDFWKGNEGEQFDFWASQQTTVQDPDPQCIANLELADVDSDNQLSRTEYLTFIQLQSECEEGTITSIPQSQLPFYVGLACLCLNEPNAAFSCCTGDNARITIPTQEEELRVICNLKYLGGSFCGALPPQFAPPTLPTPTLGPTQNRGIDIVTQAPSDVSSDIVSDIETNAPSDVGSEILTTPPSGDAACSSYPACAALGLTGDCCPSNGIFLDCCTQSVSPSDAPSDAPSDVETLTPTSTSSDELSVVVSDAPSDVPTVTASESPSDAPSDVPTVTASEPPSDAPSDAPTVTVSESPSDAPSDAPSDVPTVTVSESPSDVPSATPTVVVSIIDLSDAPSDVPSNAPSDVSSDLVTATPTQNSGIDIVVPVQFPSDGPTSAIVTSDAPSDSSSDVPSTTPTVVVSIVDLSDAPSDAPSDVSSDVVTSTPTLNRDIDIIVPVQFPSDSPATSTSSDSPTIVPSDVGSEIVTDPVAAETAACANYPVCATLGLIDDCCPTKGTDIFLDCCFQTETPSDVPSLSPTLLVLLQTSEIPSDVGSIVPISDVPSSIPSSIGGIVLEPTVDVVVTTKAPSSGPSLLRGRMASSSSSNSDSSANGSGEIMDSNSQQGQVTMVSDGTTSSQQQSSSASNSNRSTTTLSQFMFMGFLSMVITFYF